MEETARIIALAGLLQDIGTFCCRAGGRNKQGRGMLAACLPEGQSYEALLQCIGCHHQAIGVKHIKHKEHIAYLIYAAADITAGAGRRPAAEYSGGAGRAAAGAREYQQLWRRLEASLWQTDFSACTVEQVLAVMRSVAAGVPYSLADTGAGNISLYDHSRLTAALAVCLYRYFAAAGISDYRYWCAGASKTRCRTVPAFLLLGGELAGNGCYMQAISAIREQPALQAYCLDKLLTVFGLSRAHLLYADNARFCVLAPNVPEVTGLLAMAAATINGDLHRQFGAGLCLALVRQEADACALMNGGWLATPPPQAAQLAARFFNVQSDQQVREQQPEMWTMPDHG